MAEVTLTKNTRYGVFPVKENSGGKKGNGLIQ